MRIAVLDLGTNTFNLLVADTTPISFKQIYLERYPVKLGAGGIHLGHITQEACTRALKAMEHYKEIIDNFNPNRVMAYGTSALRSAGNGRELIQQIHSNTGIEIHIISGEREAELIFKGITAAIAPQRTYLVMDIGGGSVEFILAENKNQIWSQSFPLGIARLLELFKPDDPITSRDETVIQEYLDKMLAPLWEITGKHQPEILVGASGTFDSLYSMAVKSGMISGDEEAAAVEIPPDVFAGLFSKLIHSTLDERLHFPGLVSYRADMIVVAAIFVNFVHSRLNIKKIFRTGYALKEGVIMELVNDH